MADDEVTVQKVGVKFEVDEESKDKALQALDQVGEKAKGAQEKIKEGNVEQGKFAEFLKKDFGSALGNVVGQFGEIASLLRAGGPLAAGATAFILLETRASELAKNAVDVNRQFEALRETSKDIAKIWVELKDLGFSNEQSAGLIVGLTKTGAFPTKEMLEEGAFSTAALSKQTGIPIEDLGNIVAQAIRTGALEPGQVGAGLVRPGGGGLLQNLIKGADEAEMSLGNYSKSVFDLWQTTRNYNIDFQNTSKILNSWHEELNKGLMTVADLAGLASGQTMSESQKVFAAQNMGITGSPLEMMTKFEELLSSDRGIDKLGKFVFDRANQMARSPEELVQFVRMFNQSLAGGAFTEVRTLRGAAEFIDRFGTEDRKKEVRDAFKEVFDAQSKEAQSARDENSRRTEQVLQDLNNIQDILDTIKVNTFESRSLFENVKAGFDNLRTTLSGELMGQTPSTISEVKQRKEEDRKAFLLTGATARAEQEPLFGARDADRLRLMLNVPNKPSDYQLPVPVRVESESTVKIEVNGTPAGQKSSKKEGKQSFSFPGVSTEAPKVRVD